MKAWIVSLLFVLPWCLLADELETKTKWEKQKQTESYEIYSANKDGSEFLQIRAIVNVTADFESVAKEFGSSGKCWRWQSRCKRVKLSDDFTKLYSLIDMPWPLTDRDFLFTISTDLDQQAGTFSLILQPDTETINQSKYVRGTSNINYLIEKIASDQTRVTIHMHTEFGGDVSSSLINGKLVSSLEEDIELLLENVTK